MKVQILVLSLIVSSISALPSGFIFNSIRFPDPRIVGGVNVTIADYPFQASLQRSGRHICGCSIISSRFIITAAHCTDGASASILKVRVGSSFHAKDGTVIEVEKIIQHPKYDSWIIDYDYSILQLKSDIEFNDEVKIIAIPCAKNDVGAGYISSVSGWGNTQSIHESSDQLRAVYVEIIYQTDCINAYSKMNALVTERGYYEEGGKDACQGDSGGPLSIDYNGKKILVGIVSWGFGCAKPLYPGVYSRVSEVADWIMENTGIEECEKIENSFRLFDHPLMRGI